MFNKPASENIQLDLGSDTSVSDTVKKLYS